MIDQWTTSMALPDEAFMTALFQTAGAFESCAERTMNDRLAMIAEAWAAKNAAKLTKRNDRLKDIQGLLTVAQVYDSAARMLWTAAESITCGVPPDDVRIVLDDFLACAQLLADQPYWPELRKFVRQLETVAARALAKRAATIN
jgi:hypothetical protein